MHITTSQSLFLQLPLWMEKVGDEEKELQKTKYLENEKSSLEEIKSIFQIFQWFDLFGHQTMTDRDKCLTDLKLFQSDTVFKS